ncbi:MAG: cephalosporin hydroxylase family protein [Gaiellaceae bacterium]
MRLTIDTETASAEIEDGPDRTSVPLYSTAGFEALSELWLKVGWNQKHVYTFSWLGRPIIQLPDDLVRIQELVHELEPDVILETGIAHGGSLVFYASLCKLLGRGRVVGIDIEIRPHNRSAIEAHPLAEHITLIEGSSTSPETIATVREQLRADEKTLVILDSNHTREHVRAELEAYAGFVSVGSYIVAMDGIMALVADTPRGEESWSSDNPISAVQDFLGEHPEFVAERPAWPFNESELRSNITHWPHGFLRRVARTPAPSR